MSVLLRHRNKTDYSDKKVIPTFEHGMLKA
jgi:hypothetical protein